MPSLLIVMADYLDSVLPSLSGDGFALKTNFDCVSYSLEPDLVIFLLTWDPIISSDSTGIGMPAFEDSLS